MPHPNQPGMEIWYTSMESPDVSACIFGNALLVNGDAVVPLPEHFGLVASPNSLLMTVQLTPLSPASLGLAVVAKSPQQISVQELEGGQGTYEFSYMVTAVRAGWEAEPVIVPSDDDEGPGLDP